MDIQMTINQHVLKAKLADNVASHQFWESLPIKLSMTNLYGREFCYRMGAGALPDDAARNKGYEVGDISYWPPRGSLVILYKQNGEIFEQVPIGHIEDSIDFLADLNGSYVLFERADD